MADLTAHKRALAAVEAATGLDAEIDRLIDELLYDDNLYPPPLRKVTASLDAVIALVEREMPGQWWSIEKHDTGCDAWMPGVLRGISAGTPALALLAAFLKARIAELEQETVG